MRIKSLDFIKGITILSVINMHVCAWSGTLYLPDYYRSLSALWNVPVFFFIAGFLSADKSDANDSFLYVASQSIKILRDLLIVITFCLVASTIYLAVINPSALFTYNFFDNALAAVIFKPGGIFLAPWRVLPGSYWFIVIYFKLLFTLPAYYLIRDNIRSRPLLILALCYWFFVLLLDKTFLFYIPFFWLGFIYKVKSGIISPPIAIIISSLIFAAYGIWVFITKAFPVLSITSLGYMIIELVPILILTILMNMEGMGIISYRGFLSKFLQWAGRNSFRIYLWEAIFTSLPYFYISFLQNSMSRFSLYGFNLVMSFTLTVIAVRLHEIFLSKYNNSKLRAWFIRSWLPVFQQGR
jgi:fucose 4-O-acetylase-like acetyltransferase